MEGYLDNYCLKNTNLSFSSDWGTGINTVEESIAAEPRKYRKFKAGNWFTYMIAKLKSQRRDSEVKKEICDPRKPLLFGFPKGGGDHVGSERRISCLQRCWLTQRRRRNALTSSFLPPFSLVSPISWTQLEGAGKMQVAGIRMLPPVAPEGGWWWAWEMELRDNKLRTSTGT